MKPSRGIRYELHGKASDRGLLASSVVRMTPASSHKATDVSAEFTAGCFRSADDNVVRFACHCSLVRLAEVNAGTFSVKGCLGSLYVRQ
jgi:hypothetical protein